MRARLLLVVLAWALVLAPLAVRAQKADQGDALAERDADTMDDLVRQIEDMVDQRTLLQRNIRRLEAQLEQDGEKLAKLKGRIEEADATLTAQQPALAATPLATTTPAPASADADAGVPAAPVQPTVPAVDADMAKEIADRAAAVALRDELQAAIEQKRIELEIDQEALRERERQIKKARKKLVEFERSLRLELEESRDVRCMFALCWGRGGTQYAVEPVVDLPIGIAFAVGGGALTSYLNANKLSIEFNAGLRFWFWHDRLSVMIFFSKPVLETGDRIRLEGSEFEHPTSSVHRPFPNIGFGFFGDLLQIGIAYDVLLNGDARADRDPSYRPNQVLSQALTITVGFSTVLTARTAIAEARDDDDGE